MNNGTVYIEFYDVKFVTGDDNAVDIFKIKNKLKYWKI